MEHGTKLVIPRKRAIIMVFKIMLRSINANHLKLDRPYHYKNYLNLEIKVEFK